MAKIERARFLNSFTDEQLIGCSRLYFGAEFCFWRLPSPEQIIAARERARQSHLDFTLVTPVLSESEFQNLEGVLSAVLPRLEIGDEVLISDWGALGLAREIRPDLKIILGRALSGQKRGPRILDMSLTPQQLEYFKSGSWHNDEAVALLKEQEIHRIEQDNLLQGLAPLPKGLKGSLHVPYAMVATTRNCPFRDASHEGPCPVACGEVFTLRSDQSPTDLLQDGNTQFLFNDTQPKNLLELGIDRIVSHPKMS